MMAAGRLSVLANRWQPNFITLDFVGYDFTGAAFKSQVRAYRDAPDPALITLQNATAGAQGISCVVVTEGSVATSTVTLQFDETTIEALPFANPKGTDLELVWDLTIDPTDGAKLRWLEGPFIVHGGSTQI